MIHSVSSVSTNCFVQPNEWFDQAKESLAGKIETVRDRICTAYENVEVPLLYGENKAGEKERIERALESVGLTRCMTHFPSELTGGECLRVAIARALVIEPSIILADEPTGNLDPSQSAQIMELFKRLRYEGATILVVTHDPRISTYCQRTIRILDGKICNS